MKLRIENSTTYVSQATDADTAWLFDFLAFEDSKAVQRQRMGYRVPDAHVRLFDRRRLSFPTGLIPIVIEGAAKRDVRIMLDDQREPLDDLIPRPVLEADPWRMRGAWSFQANAIEAAHAGTGRLTGRAIIKSPTGSGKGNLAAALAFALPGKWLFVVHRGHLAADVRNRWNELAGSEPEAGFIGEGEWTVGERLTCATLQTLHTALKSKSKRFADLTREITGMIVDECHVAPAASFYRTIQAFKRARYRFGLSGTPLDRGDRRSLMAIASIGPIAYQIKARDLIDAGVLAEPRIRVVPCYQKASEQSRGDWNRTYSELVVSSSHRNGAILSSMDHALAIGATPGMVFVRRVGHGRALADLATKRGLNVAFVDGTKDTAQRRRSILALEAGKLDFIVATKVFVEGVNVPELRSVVNAAGGKSVIEALQQVGRGTRTTDSKSRFDVYDIGDKGERVLNNHARERFRAYRREGYSVEVDREIYPERVGE